MARAERMLSPEQRTVPETNNNLNLSTVDGGSNKGLKKSNKSPVAATNSGAVNSNQMFQTESDIKKVDEPIKVSRRQYPG